MPETAVDLSAALERLTDELAERAPAAIDRWLTRMRRDVPSFFVRDDDPEFVALYRDSYAEQLREICAGLLRRPELAERELPTLVAQEARESAALGIPLSSFLRVCRLGHRLLFDEAAAIAAASIVDGELLGAVLRETSDWLFEWFDWLTVRQTEVYERERDLLLRDRERRRRLLVQRLLEGEPVDAAALDYRLAQDHLAVVAWGAEAARALCLLAEAAGAELLTVPGSGTTAWGWLGAASVEPGVLAAVRAYTPPAGTQLAVGEPGAGADGFRASHHQAWSTYRIAREREAPVTLHADVALLTLALQDPALARTFVLRELGPLADRDERAAVLRETLAAYFASGQNAASAAAALGVHSRTVIYRMRSIEERLGRPIAARRDELAVALRLSAVVLGDDGPA